MNTRIRPMQEQDLAHVLQLSANAAEAPQWTHRDYEALFAATPEAMVVTGLRVAEANNELVGFAVIRWLRGERAAELESAVVDRAYRRQGIGVALIRSCLDWAGSNGASAVRLEVRSSNAAALALYHRLGFVSAGVRRNYYSTPREDAIVLEAPL